MTLLNVFLDHYSVGKDARTSRLFLIAEVDSSYQSIQQIEGFHNEFVSSQNKDEPVTGALFIINSSVCVHLLEAPSKVLMHLLRTLHESSENPSTAVARNIKVVHFTEEVSRQFPIWQLRSVKIVSETDCTVSSGAVLKAVFDVMKGILELGREMKSLANSLKAQEHIHSTKNAVMQKIPSSERLRAFCAADELCSLSEYLQIYDAPAEFSPDSEKTWPVEEFIKVLAFVHVSPGIDSTLTYALFLHWQY